MGEYQEIVSLQKGKLESLEGIADIKFHTAMTTIYTLITTSTMFIIAIVAVVSHDCNQDHNQNLCFVNCSLY